RKISKDGASMRHSLISVSVIFLVLASSTQAYSADLAGSVSHPLFPLREGPPATMKFPPVSSLRFGEFLIYLGLTDLSDIPKTMNVGEITRTGDGAECSDTVCYTITNASPPFRILLMSGCAMYHGKVVSMVASKINAADHA